MRRFLLVPFLITVIFSSCYSQKTKTPFSFNRNSQGVELLENGKPVFFYQEKQKSLDGQYICDNYLHPLYSLTGDTLTEEFPADHLYHRGIFWAWHQWFINGKSVGDGWIMENTSQQVVKVKTSVKNHLAQFELNVLWKSSIFENNKPFISERTIITVHPVQDSIRKIDFAISLKALLPGVEIGGADDEKGYGGLCARLKLPNDLTFTSDNKSVTPELGQIKAGPWMDFSASFGRKGETSGIAILCHPQTPNYPESWILRSATSMQNIVFPGRKRVEIPLDKTLSLYYRIIVHNGKAESVDLNKFQAEYENSDLVKE